MPCDTRIIAEPNGLQRVQAAIARLEAALAAGTVSIAISAGGAIAFRNWRDNGGLSDLCAYRRLAASNSPALRRALARAEALAGRSLNPQAIAAGVHSHDGGQTWGSH